jgi:hypothetical protein
MQVEALITDVTSLRSPRVCIAALAGDRAIRLHSPTPGEGWVDGIGGLMPGDVIDVEWKPGNRPYPPHVEDGDWDPTGCRKVEGLSEDELVQRLGKIAFNSVEETFGKPWIEAANGNCAFRPGRGSLSLASVRASSVGVRVQFGKVRVQFTDARRTWAGVPLQDLAVKRHLNNCKACRSKFDSLIRSEFDGSRALLRVGLARQFQVGEYPSACWMQVNHVFLIPSKRKHFA